jgi:hypothetical protein
MPLETRPCVTIRSRLNSDVDARMEVGLGGRRPRRSASVVTAASSASISTSSNCFSAPAKPFDKNWRCCEARLSGPALPFGTAEGPPPSRSAEPKIGLVLSPQAAGLTGPQLWRRWLGDDRTRGLRRPQRGESVRGARQPDVPFRARGSCRESGEACASVGRATPGTCFWDRCRCPVTVCLHPQPRRG